MGHPISCGTHSSQALDCGTTFATETLQLIHCHNERFASLINQLEDSSLGMALKRAKCTFCLYVDQVIVKIDATLTVLKSREANQW